MDIESFAIGMKYGAKSGGGGAGGSVLVVHIDDDTGALDKTWQEIHDADFAVIKSIDANTGDGYEWSIVTNAGSSGGVYEIVAAVLAPSPATWSCITDSANGYPVYAGD